MLTIIRTSKQSLVVLGMLSMLLTPRLVAAACLGDCDGNNSVTAGDVGKIIQTILRCGPCPGDIPGGIPGGCAAFPNGCPNADGSPTDGCIRAGELGKIIQNVLRTPGGCGEVATPTNTPNVTTPLPTLTPTPVPTNTPTNTNVPTPTATPTTAVITATPTVTITPGGPTPSLCGNGVINAGEECDDGGTCVGGTNDGQKCPSNVAGGVDCAAPGVCTPFGGDGCAVNCTNEISVHLEFTGAKCQGVASNPKTGQPCTFTVTCIGGAFPGKPCIANSDCGPSGNQGVCTSECALDGNGQPTNDGSTCVALGQCVLGDAAKIGTACITKTSTSVPFPIQLTCTAPANQVGKPCATATDCAASGGVCTNVCGQAGKCFGGANDGAACTAQGNCPGGSCGGRCEMSSFSTLTATGLIKLLGIGPLIGGEDLMIGKADPDGRRPVTIPADSVFFAPVKVQGLACACPRGVAVPDVFGPGNSGAGYISCGATGPASFVVNETIDHNTNAFNANNGPGACSAGTRAGLGCGNDADCPGGGAGSCANKGQGGGLCTGGVNKDKPCKLETDCPNSRCAATDAPIFTCNATEPPPPNGSGSAACLETKTKCFGGPIPGASCTTDVNCFGGTCGIECAPAGMHPGICNSPHILTIGQTGNPGDAVVQGSALIRTSTAIGTISVSDGDAGTCNKAAYCIPFAFGSTPKACQVDAECTAPALCKTAFCGGKCTGGVNAGKACLSTTADCPGGGTCTQGSNFGVACTGGVAGECGANNICKPVNFAKGFDGLPCTDDDSPAAKGTAATIVTTTGAASAGIVDANNSAGFLIDDGICTVSSGTHPNCITSTSGHIFDCSQIDSGHLSGASLSAAFTQLDAAITLDQLITTKFTAK